MAPRRWIEPDTKYIWDQMADAELTLEELNQVLEAGEEPQEEESPF